MNRGSGMLFLAILSLTIAAAAVSAVVVRETGPVAPGAAYPEGIPPPDLVLLADERALDALEPSGATLVVTRAPGELTTTRAMSLRAFAEGGGRILVVQDASAAEALDSPLAPWPISGPNATQAPPSFAVIAGVGTSTLSSSDDDAFLDVDGDGRLSSADAAGPFALAVASHGGRVLVLGAPLDDITRDVLAPELRSMFPAVATVVHDKAPRGTAALGGALLRAAFDLGDRHAVAVAVGPLGGISLVLLALGAPLAASTLPAANDVRLREEP